MLWVSGLEAGVLAVAMNRFHKFLHYLFSDTSYLVRYIFRFYQDSYREHVQFLTDRETVAFVERGGSFLRMGDGEIGLIHGNPIHYQRFSPEIKKKLLQIIAQYNEGSSFRIGLPLFVNFTNYELRNLEKSNMLNCWLPLKVTFDMIFPRNVPYVDAHLFYRDGKFESLLLPYLRKKKLILVANEESLCWVKKSDIHNSVGVYITCPPADAFEMGEKLVESIRIAALSMVSPRADIVVLLQAGLAKLYVPEIAALHLQVIDAGKGFDGYVRGESLEWHI